MMSSQLNSLPTMPLGRTPHPKKLLKRFVDIGVAVLLIFLLYPLFISLFIGVKLSSKGPGIFSHQRIGCGGKLFLCFKFRTMVPDAATVLEDYLAKNEEARLEWASSQKLKRDPRITPIGVFLRRSSLDELPQIFNVLIGDMSLVGPRPIVPSEASRYGDDIEHYISVRPGITGLWQVRGRSDVQYSDRVRLDTQYVQTWSIAQDFRIMLETIPIIVSQKGSY